MLFHRIYHYTYICHLKVLLYLSLDPPPHIAFPRVDFTRCLITTVSIQRMTYAGCQRVYLQTCTSLTSSLFVMFLYYNNFVDDVHKRSTYPQNLSETGTQNKRVRHVDQGPLFTMGVLSELSMNVSTLPPVKTRESRAPC